LRKKWTLRGDIIEGENNKIELGSRLAVLHDLKMRPSVAGKKAKGTLNAYTKGYRFTSKKNLIFDLAHSNIKHAIFQPCDENMMIILHFRLFKAVQVNKKRVKDVQFYCEVGSIAEDLNDPRRNRNRFDYPNEMEEEEMERYMQQKYNDAFLNFVETVNKKAENAIPFESPFIDYSFYGSPFYNNVLISPCDRCLVSIVDTPLFVLSLDEIEIVSIERIDNKIKNFDLIIIFKDYSRNVQSISNIPKSDLEKIRQWLDSKDILFFEGGKINLKWDNILKRIRENAKTFIFEDGGWREFFEDDDASDANNDDADEESSFNEEDLEDEGEDPYEEDEFLNNLEDDEDEDDEEDYFSEEEFDDDDDDDDEEVSRKANKKKKRRK
jgi:nucleosome binding factor SPN SPT16 subunit